MPKHSGLVHRASFRAIFVSIVVCWPRPSSAVSVHALILSLRLTGVAVACPSARLSPLPPTTAYPHRAALPCDATRPILGKASVSPTGWQRSAAAGTAPPASASHRARPGSAIAVLSNTPSLFPATVCCDCPVYPNMEWSINTVRTNAVLGSLEPQTSPPNIVLYHNKPTHTQTDTIGFPVTNTTSRAAYRLLSLCRRSTYGLQIKCV